MSAWNSSSLAFSDHNNTRHQSGLLKNTPTRVSKRDIVENKMFGSKRGMHGADFGLSKKFKGFGKGILKGSTSPRPKKNMQISGTGMQSHAISPSTKEFDKMMSSITKGSKGPGKSSGFGKKSMFSRKSFG